MGLRSVGTRSPSKNERLEGPNTMDRSCVRNQVFDRHRRPPTSPPSAQTLREAYARGITQDEIENALRIMPFVRKSYCFRSVSSEHCLASCDDPRRPAAQSCW